jgi:hypothetical protein
MNTAGDMLEELATSTTASPRRRRTAAESQPGYFGAAAAPAPLALLRCAQQPPRAEEMRSEFAPRLQRTRPCALSMHAHGHEQWAAGMVVQLENKVTC